MQARKLTNPLDRCRPDIVLETCSMSSRTFPAGCNKVVTHAVVVWKDGRSCTDLSTHVTDCCHPCNTRQLIHAPPRWFTCPQAVTHHGTNQAWRRVTSLHPKRVTNYATPPTRPMTPTKMHQIRLWLCFSTGTTLLLVLPRRWN